jgi:hypothetical protein
MAVIGRHVGGCSGAWSEQGKEEGGCSGAVSEPLRWIIRVMWACAKKPKAVRQLVLVCGVNGGCGIRQKENHPDALIQAFSMILNNYFKIVLIYMTYI